MPLFGTSGVRGPVGETITTELGLSIGRAVGSTRPGPVVVGRDARESGEWLIEAVVAGVRECRTDVVDIGRVTTPTLARTVTWQDASAGIMVTASHNPPEDNGFKLWSADGSAFDAEQRREIEARIRDETFDLAGPTGGRRREPERDPVERHRRLLVESVDAVEAVGDRSVVVDVGNGMGRITADALTDLGCTVETLNAQLDGEFPGRPSEPTADNCSSLRQYVGASEADLGIAHDGDADRMMAVTESGEFVPGDVLLALFAREVAGAGDRIAAPVNTSRAVDDALEAVGASVVRTKVGDTYVAERTAEADVVFGGEPSGAWIWPDGARCPDGPLAAVRLVEIVAGEGSFDAVVDGIGGYPIRRESIRATDKGAIVDRVEELVREAYDEDQLVTLDGVRVDLDDGWFLVRASGTQPLVRATAESSDPDRADEIVARAIDLIERATDE
ncbi:MAG: phosphoglucosamine mutase [Halobacteriales archaeon]|jgi:phosphoglucosamine mutase